MGKAAAAPEQADDGKPALPRRKLGKTGAEVSVLALGGGFDTVNNQLLLRQALNWGVNFWDTAEAYGNGSSEEGYGRFLARNSDARKKMFLTTKLHSGEPEAMTAALDKCLKRLATDYVDLLHVHGINDFSEIAEPKPVKQWVSEMKKAGRRSNFSGSALMRTDGQRFQPELGPQQFDESRGLIGASAMLAVAPDCVDIHCNGASGRSGRWQKR